MDELEDNKIETFRGKVLLILIVGINSRTTVGHRIKAKVTLSLPYPGHTTKLLFNSLSFTNCDIKVFRYMYVQG